MANTFFGVPIEGDITPGHMSAPQLPDEDLGAMIQAIFSHEDVEGIRWYQCTPYFNDGDACVFRSFGAYVRIADQFPRGGDYEDGYLSRWDNQLAGGKDYEIPALQHPRHPVADSVAALDEALTAGSFDHFLLKTFGDHATVTMTRDKVEVEFYEHD